MKRSLIPLIAILLASISVVAVAKTPIRLGYVDFDEVVQPEFSPDGSLLVYLSRPSGPTDSLGLHIVPVTDLSQPELLERFDYGQRASPFIFSVEGESLAYRVNGNDPKIMHVMLPELKSNRVTDADIGSGSISRLFTDTIVYLGEQNGSRELYRVALDGSNHERLTPEQYVWDYAYFPGTNTVLYSTLTGRQILKLEEGNAVPAVVAELDQDSLIFSVSPDQTKIAFSFSSVSIGEGPVFKPRYAADIADGKQWPLEDLIHLTAIGWISDRAATYLIAGLVRDPLDPSIRRSQIQIHELDNRVKSVIEVPKGLIQGGAIWHLSDKEVLFGVGPLSDDGYNSLGNQALWKANYDGSYEEVVKPNGDLGGFALLNSNLALRFARNVDTQEWYVNKIDLASGIEDRLFAGSVTFCQSRRESLAFFSFNRRDINPGTPELLVFDGVSERFYPVSLDSPSELRLERSCTSNSNDRLMTFRKPVAKEGFIIGYEYYLLEVPIFDSAFEVSTEFP